jgi:predicted nucleic acid-binding protein
MGNLRDFDLVIRFMQGLHHVDVARDEEVVAMVRKHKLSGVGIGYTDAHLIASILITPATLLWTRDKRLHAVAERFGLAIKP